ncbi:MAG TPA: hypothetical protein PKD86_17215 [Gemmatales bacterium]|nr:hypothetical protein [Gemmatales bacterium]HMP61085.1 hypothetical protein [Gemmatales bacterium]
MPTLELMKTRLRLEESELVQLNANGNPVMRLPLAKVKRLEFRRVLEPIGLAFLTVGLVLWCIGFFVSENNIVSTLLYVGAVLVAAFGLLGILSDRIFIQTDSTHLLLECPDPSSEGQGFVLSANHILNPEPSPQEPSA